MVTLGYATQEEVDASFAEYWANHDYTRTANTAAFLERLENDPAPWFTEHVRIKLQEELLLGAANIYTDGYSVYTTLDLDYQKVAQRELWKGIQDANETYRRNKVNNESRIERFLPMLEMLALGFDVENIKVGTERDQKRAAIYFRDEVSPMLDMVSMMFDATEQDALRQVTKAAYLDRQQVTQRSRVEGALITLENDTGHILAMVGGSPFESGNQNNRAISAMRPPGSSFKPLYYSAAINNGTITPATVFTDSWVTFFNDDGTPYIPENYNGDWNGPTRARYALATSMNVVSLKVLEAVGFTEAFNVAGRLLGLNETQMAERGFEPRYPVGLGTVSVSPLLMARAFATFPNGGREVIPISVRYIEDRRGNRILDPAQDVAQELVRKGNAAQIISPQAAYIMVDMLQSTVEYGTLRNRSILVGGFDGMPMAGKTGTTQNWSDAWTVGFSPYVTTAVWLGFDRGGSNSLGTNQTGAQTAGPIWAWYMKEIHEDLPIREFDRPPGLVEVTVTAESGKLPTENYQGATIDEIFIAGTEPTQFDSLEDFHRERSRRIAETLSRPTAIATTASLADRLLGIGLLDSVVEEDEPETTDFGDGANPFFSDPPQDQGVNPFFAPPEPETVPDEPATTDQSPSETPQTNESPTTTDPSDTGSQTGTADDEPEESPSDLD
jgi:penicillin-binding protein 1A